MKLLLAILLAVSSFSAFSKSCFDRKYKKKYEKCLQANITNQKKCKKKRDKWKKECRKEDQAKEARQANAAKFKSVDDLIKKGRVANQSLEVWKDGKPYGWTVKGSVKQTNGGFDGSKGAVISGKGSISQTRRIPSRRWHGILVRANFNRGLGSASQGVKTSVTIKKNGATQRTYENSLNFPYANMWEMSNMELKPELYESDITLNVSWDLPKGATATLDEIRILDISSYEKATKGHRSYLKKEALK